HSAGIFPPLSVRGRVPSARSPFAKDGALRGLAAMRSIGGAARVESDPATNLSGKIAQTFDTGIVSPLRSPCELKVSLMTDQEHRKGAAAAATLKPGETMTSKEIRTNNEAAIRELIDRFAKAFRVKDVDGCMSVFAPEIVSYDILPPLQAVGAEAFVSHWQEFFGSYQGQIDVEFPDVTIAAGDEVAFSHCLHRIAGTLKTGQKTDFWLRWT